MNNLKIYSNFIKAEHTLFSLPIIFSGAFLAAKGVPDIKILLLIIVAGIGARTSAMAVNRILDRKIDKLNPRTKDRELPSGKINLRTSFLITICGTILYLVSAYFICGLVFKLSPIPLIVFIVYPLLKKFTQFCHFGVGLALGLAPLGGFIAVTCSLENSLPGVLLGLFAFFWVSGFDIIYATLDEEFDRNEGIYSLVSVYGKPLAMKISAACHILAVVFLLFLYFIAFKSMISFIILIMIAFLLYMEHKKSSDVDLAFFKINIVIGSMVFVFILGGIYFI
ncbi:MAG: UbiA-like polyprenyltransferase [Thermodesulfobacteriota bacterium]